MCRGGAEFVDIELGHLVRVSVDDGRALPDDDAVVDREDHQMSRLREIRRQAFGPDRFVEHFVRDAFEGAGIIDVAPTILYTLGMPIPSDMDGKPLVQLFEDSYTQQSAASYTDERKFEDVASDEYGYSEEEEESVRLKLEALGYL